MSDYMFMLENHLTSAQNRVLAEVRREALEENVNVFLTGGAVRDMLGGFPIGDLDFTVEGNALRLAKAVADRMNADDPFSDSNRKAAELVSPEGATFEIGMARTRAVSQDCREAPRHRGHYSGGFASPRFHNQCAGSLPESCFSRVAARPDKWDGRSGTARDTDDQQLCLLRQPDPPAPFVALQGEAGVHSEEKTVSQYRNARESELETFITRPELLSELKKAATEPNTADLLQAWDEEKLLASDFTCAGRAGAEFARFCEASEIPSNAAVRNWLADRRGSAFLCDTDRETHP